MKKLLSRFLFFLAVLTSLLAVSAHAITLTVTSAADAGGTCPGANCTLRQAIAKFNGDIINFAPGITMIELTSGELVVSKNVTINGPGANVLTVKRSSAAGTPNFRIFHIGGNLTVAISGMRISNGNAALAGNEGGGILSDGTLSINSCAIYGNASDGYGGGVAQHLAASKMTIRNSSIYNNSAGLGAGGVSCFNGTLTIDNCTISDNLETGNGGGGGIINEGGTITITNSTIAFNRSVFGGGMFNNDNAAGSISARNTIVAKNSATVQSPDVASTLISNGYNLIGNNDLAKIVPTTGDQIGTKAAPIDPLLGQFVKNGGPIETRAPLSGSPVIEKGDSGGTSTDQRGFARPVDSPNIPNVGDGSDIGAYEVQADVLPGCATINRVVKNGDDSGADSLRGVIASVCAGSTITFDPNLPDGIGLTTAELLINKSLTIAGPGPKILGVGRPNRSSGAPKFRIFNIAANVNVAISGVGILFGDAPDFGGGIANHGTLTLTDDLITVNSAPFGGGGIYNPGVLTINRSILQGNSANTGAAGISNSGTLTVINSTFNGNTAHGGNGGAIVNTGTVTLTSSTISSNTATGAGGGIHNASGTITARNSIIALNTGSPGPDYNGALTSQGFNLIGNSSGTIISPAQFTDQLGTAGAPIDPLLSFGGYNGGLTFTRPLLPGSPAIDKGDSGGLTTDQRGFLRAIDLSSVANATGGDGADIGAFEVQATTLANVSTRLPVQTGDNVLFAGFIVTGTQDKRVAVLAIGPSLSGFGVAGALANPTLELYQGNTLLESNDDWINSANKQAIIDAALAPTDNLESAIIRTLPANSSQYSAIVRGVNSGTGVGVLQVYDLDVNGASKLANISTRGLVQTGDNVLIAGTIVRGQTPQTVLVEALGPSTSVPGNLADPTLELRDVNGDVVDANDNWIDSPNKQAIIDSTVPPGNNQESALVKTLPANGAQYTAIVRGVGGTTGVAVVQIFALD